MYKHCLHLWSHIICASISLIKVSHMDETGVKEWAETLPAVEKVEGYQVALMCWCHFLPLWRKAKGVLREES